MYNVCLVACVVVMAQILFHSERVEKRDLDKMNTVFNTNRGFEMGSRARCVSLSSRNFINDKLHQDLCQRHRCKRETRNFSVKASNSLFFVIVNLVSRSGG